MHLLRPASLDVPTLVAAFTTRRGGVSEPPFASLNLGMSTGDVPECVEANRARVAEALDLPPGRLALAGQVHGAEVRTVDAPGVYPGFDGLVTTTPYLLLGVVAADCAAVLLADVEVGVVGACHSGWRGTVARITLRTVERMRELGARPERLRAYVGPCISAAHFEVGPEVAEQFDDAFVLYPNGPDEKPHVDLKAALAAQLAEAGVPPVHTEIASACTIADNEAFFSYRAEGGTTGRMMGLIGLR